jgi:hypothetical protein
MKIKELFATKRRDMLNYLHPPSIISYKLESSTGHCGNLGPHITGITLCLCRFTNNITSRGSGSTDSEAEMYTQHTVVESTRSSLFCF